MSRPESIALISTSCRFPDANSPAQLWANVVEGRRSFRVIPAERLDLRRYAADVVGEADSITPIRAGLLTDWTVDRDALRIPKNTFAATDLTHFLALELATAAIAAIGGFDRLDRARTAVVVANTLTGEFSRAALLRLRLPFLDEILAQAGAGADITREALGRLRSGFADELRRRFPDPNEDSLAGGLANTIAGRIANHFDLNGGAYSVDGACASSLVALADAANLLASGQADAVVVAAVDLSLDPFELVGFSRNGALAAGEMRVFDARANGFWPGEGGACVLMVRGEVARRLGLPVLARLRGWGISTDGAGGLTRPSSDGQLLASRRACEMAGVDPADLAFVEAHGTGTAVGDPIEVRALAQLRDGARAPLPIGSIKANIGHAKAAAGLAGLLKAVEALRHGVVPPHVSCERPHPVFAEVDGRVRPARACEPLAQRACLAGVSSFGFGGINVHVVLEGDATTRAPFSAPRTPLAQDAELFLFGGDTDADVADAIAAFENRAPSLSMSELADAAAHAWTAASPGGVRAAIVASHADELAERLARAKAAVAGGEVIGDAADGVFVARPARPPRIGFLFPGQSAPCRPDGGAWSRRFGDADGLIAKLPAGTRQHSVATEFAQPAIVAASLAALRILERFGVAAAIAAGHSLGEITALAWAGALDRDAALDLARRRGAIMAGAAIAGGAMLRVALPPDEAAPLARDTGLVVACRNGRSETVLAGPADAVAAAAMRCRDRGIETAPLAVSHAFHSPDMAPAAAELGMALAATPFAPLQRPVASTVTGAVLPADADLAALLVDQLTEPVLFDAGLDVLATHADILVEVGPGHGLTRLAHNAGLAAWSVDAFAESLAPLLTTAAALFTAGLDIRAAALFEDRGVRAFAPAAVPRFLASPCGSCTEAPALEGRLAPLQQIEPAISHDRDPLAVVVAVIAHETGSPASSIGADNRFLDALHLNSLAVTRIVAAAARALDVRAPSAPTEFANATPRILADALAELAEFTSDQPDAPHRVAGVRPWVRTYAMTWAPVGAPPHADDRCQWMRVDLGRDIPAPSGTPTDGLLVRIAGRFDTEDAERLIARVAEAAKAGVQHIVLLHDCAPVSAFARSVAGEGHFRSVRVIDRGDAGDDDPRLTTLLAASLEGFHEIRLNDDGGFAAPIFVPTEAVGSPLAAITSDDVVMVVGGGKGIAAECALRLAGCGAAVILVGRSAVDDADVAATLARARRRRLRCQYVRADVLEPSKLPAALAPAFRRFGAPTALIYAPAVNEPRRVIDLDPATVSRALAPKTRGLQVVLDLLGPSLRRLVTFGSILGRIGLEGESHYALANAMQSAATEAWAANAPGRTALAIEWSLWGGAGMGERLGTVERLAAAGVDALSVDDALGAFDRLIAGNATGTIAVTGRFGPPPALSLGPAPLPSLRFVDEPKVHFPGVELVVETTLSQGRDLYLDDHVIDGLTVLPAVLGLEAMAQVASALAPLGPRIAVSDVSFSRTIRIAPGGSTCLRIAALRSGPATEVALLADDDGFAAPCMRATFGIGRALTSIQCDSRRPGQPMAADGLYGPLFFGQNRFRRLDVIELARSRRVVASLRPDRRADWFGPFEPGTLSLWEPGSADAALHALQVAVPHRRVLPTGADRIDIDTRAGMPARVDAIERHAAGDNYTFDIVVTDASGRVACRWTNVTFRAVGDIDIAAVLAQAPALAVPYLERKARQALDDDTIEIALVPGTDASRQSRRTTALRGLGLAGRVDHRADGRLIRTDSNGAVSLAHCDHLTLAIASRTPVGCDIEPVPSTNAGEVDRLRDHVAGEVCRKLGRRPMAPMAGALPIGTAAAIDDMRLIAIDLPTPYGPHLVAIGTSRRFADAATRPPPLVKNGVTA